MWKFNKVIGDFEWTPYENPKKLLSPDVHKMNKNEGKLLRRLMAETGMNEEEVRSIKKYRKQLSDAQDRGETPLTLNEMASKSYKELCALVSRESGLPPWHPKFTRTLSKKIESQGGMSAWRLR